LSDAGVLPFPSLVSGGFDVPKEKCPPDIGSDGSSGEVTVRSAPTLLQAPPRLDSKTATLYQLHQSFSAGSTPPSDSEPLFSLHQYADIKHPKPHHHHHHHYTQQQQQQQPYFQQVYNHHAHQAPFDLPLTPPNSTPGSSPDRESQSSTPVKPINIVKTSTKVINGFTISFKEPSPLETPPSTPKSSLAKNRWMDHANPALLFLNDVFPGRGAKEALPFATSVTIEQDGTVWEGVVLDLPGKPKTLYVNGRGAESVQLRESIVALLDLADEHLDCEAFVIALERASPSLAGLIHSLLYVSGTVVSRPPFEVDERYVLVGIEI